VDRQKRRDRSKWSVIQLTSTHQDDALQGELHAIILPVLSLKPKPAATHDCRIAHMQCQQLAVCSVQAAGQLSAVSTQGREGRQPVGVQDPVVKDDVITALPDEPLDGGYAEAVRYSLQGVQQQQQQQQGRKQEQ